MNNTQPNPGKWPKLKAYFLYFGKQIAIFVIVTILLLWIATRFLDFYTMHGSTIVVPNFVGLSINDNKVEDLADDNHLQFIIADSIYDASKPKGMVLAQDPLPGTKVKKYRKVYITVIANMPERVKMPNLVDLTLRQAIAMLETYGLKVGKLSYIPDIAENSVLKQNLKGNTINPDAMVDKGSKIDLVLGKGIGNETVSIPNLIGKDREDARKAINSASLNVGVETFDDENDTIHVKVYKQSPDKSQGYIRVGSPVDIWYKSDKDDDNE
jgi:eukaryotic-like serine/threonine-protein kinase